MPRVAHISDFHLFARNARRRLGDWLGKSTLGWLNARVLTRRGLFQGAERILERLASDLWEVRPDLVLFTGDAATLGTDEEFAWAAEILRVGRPGGLPGLAVPGNHDYYTWQTARSGLFEKHFAPWLEGERLGGETYPYARRLGPVAFVALNSSAGKRWFLDSSGRAGREQIERLRRLLAAPSLSGCQKVLVTHYPICKMDGRPEALVRGLRDLAAVVEAARAGGVSLWLHGHRHHPYELAPPQSPIATFCAGSGTQRGVWTYAVYTIEGGDWKVSRRAYRPELDRFAPAGEILFTS